MPHRECHLGHCVVVTWFLLKMNRLSFAVGILDSSMENTQQRAAMGKSKAPCRGECCPGVMGCQNLPSYCEGINVSGRGREEEALVVKSPAVVILFCVLILAKHCKKKLRPSKY